MESYVAASDVHLISSLSYDQPKIAPYIIARKQVQIPAAGGDSYGPASVGAKVARFSLNTSGPFIDLSSVAITGTVSNTDGTNSLTFLGPSLGTLVQTARLLIGGVEVDRCDYANRTEGMLGLLQSPDKRLQDFSEGFGYYSGTSNGTDFVASPIPAGTSRKVVWRPKCLGSLLGTSYLPVALTSGGACVLELTFVDTAAEVCNTTAGSGIGSTSWSVSGLSAMMDVIQVDSAFLSSLGAHLAEGGSLQMSWKSYQTTYYSILAAAAQIIHSRANSRLNSLFLTFMNGVGEHTTKTCNHFHLPTNQTLKMRCQVGEQRFPDSLDNDCLPMFYHRLLHAIGAANSMAHAPCLTSATYASDGFIAAQDFEMVPGQASHSGVNTFSSQLTINLEGIGTVGAGGVTAAFVTTHHDVMLEITAAGVTVAV